MQSSSGEALPGVNALESFINFVRSCVVAFFQKLLDHSELWDSFEPVLLDALKNLIDSYVLFCRQCFVDQETSMSNIIKQFLVSCPFLVCQLLTLFH